VTGHAAWALLLVVVIAGEYVWLRPTLRARLRRVLCAPLRRRARLARRSLAALARAATGRPYKPVHAPHRKAQP